MADKRKKRKEIKEHADSILDSMQGYMGNGYIEKVIFTEDGFLLYVRKIPCDAEREIEELIAKLKEIYPVEIHVIAEW